MTETQTQAALANLRYRRERLLQRIREAEVKLAKVDADIKEMEST